MAEKMKKVPGLRVSSRPETFRRGGRVWTREAQEVPLSELGKDAIKAIKDEPLLSVQEITIETSPPGAGEGSSSAAEAEEVARK